MVGNKVRSILVLLLLCCCVNGNAQIIRTLLGDGTMPASATEGNGGLCVNAKVVAPYGVATDSKGNIYVSDNQLYNLVKKIRPNGVVTIYAGTGSMGYSGDGGPAINAMLNAPSGMVCDAVGNLYIADAGNHVVRKVDTFGVITTVAGNHAFLSTSSGGDGGPATAAPLGACSGVALDAAGNLYIANGNDRVRKVTPAGIISTVAGGTIGYAATDDGGPATNAAMEGVSDVCVDAAGNLYISEFDNNVIRKVTPAGIISTYCGRGPTLGGNTGDGGPATAAKLSTPSGIKIDAAGNLYICDVSNNRIRKINTTTRIITAYSGTTQGYGGDGGAYNASAVKYYWPTSLCFDAAGHMFIADKGPGFSGSGGGRRVREIFKVDTFHILSTPGLSLCSGSASDTFRANITGYYSYIVNWRVNGSLVAGNSVTLVRSPVNNNDRISCTITDTAHGLNLLLAVSDTLTISVGASVSPSVSISLSTTTDTICAGTNVTFNATPVNGGTAPAYQWMVGTTAVGTGSSYSYAPLNHDTVKVILTSNAPCATSSTATASVVMIVNPVADAGTISGPSSMCTGDVATLSSTGMSGGTWTAANGSATINAGGVVNAVSAGTDTFTYHVSTPSCGSATATRVTTINTLPSAGTISGLSFVCPGYNITLSNTVTGGTWSMTNSHATISTTGVVTGITAGSDTVRYSVINTCGTTVDSFPITVGVSSLLDAGTITGPNTVCNGLSLTLADTATGGFWTSTDEAVATVSTTGVVTGLAPGTTSIYYVVTSGCVPDTAIHNITVIPVLDAGTITGPSTICNGLSITLTDTTSGGSWSTSNAAVAIVDGAGHVTSLSPGTTTISYIRGNSCGFDTASQEIVVNAQPFADTITGNMLLCIGTSISLTDTASGGVWSSSVPSAATVNTAGVVTGMAAGSTVISYTVTNSCGTDVATHVVNVNAFPVFTSSTHPPSICSGTLFNYEPSSSVAGAFFNWTRPAIPGIANPTASSTGNPNEILINTTDTPINVVYIYAVSSGGCSTIQNVTVTVNPIPSLSGPLTATACPGRAFTRLSTSGAPGATYAWTRAAVTGILPATGAGTGNISEVLTNTGTTPVNVVYVFTITAAGCVGNSNLVVTVEPQGPPPPMITTHSPSWMCKNTMAQNFGTSSTPDSTVTLEWTASNAIVWAQGAGHQYSVINFPYTGFATIYLSSSITGLSCSTRDSFVVYVDPTPNEFPTLNYFGGNFIAQSGMSTYQWGYDDAITMDSTLLAGENSESYGNSSPDWAGKYYWVITEHLTCMQKTYYNVPTGIVNANAGIKEVKVYPNPTSGAFTVSIASGYTEQATVSITDMVGRTVKQQLCMTNSKTSFRLNEPAGVYLVSVQTAHGNYITRISIAQ